MQLTPGRLALIAAATHTGWDESACEADPTGCLDAFSLVGSRKPLLVFSILE